MANIGIGTARTLIDRDGDPLDNGDGKLNVVLSTSDDINIGNVVLQNDTGIDIYSAQANADVQPDLDNQTLLGTHALLSARSDAHTTIGITCEDSTHNALHVAISDGAGIANVDGNNALLVDVVAGGVLESAVDGIEGTLNTIDTDTSLLSGCVAADGGVQPAKVIAIAGSTSLGYLQTLRTNGDGKLQVDVTAIVGGADGVTIDDTSGQVLGGDVACKKIDIQAQTDNTGVIAVGFTGVDATIATGTGIILYPGDTYSLEINNLNLIYIESSVNGEGVRYTYFT